MSVDDVADDGFEDGIAEKFEALVVERFVAEFLGTILLRLMGEGRAIELDVMRAEAHDVVEGRTKLSVFGEEEFGSVE